MYKDYIYLDDDRFARFGGFQGNGGAGAFYLQVTISSTVSNAVIGSRLIKFGD